MWMLLSAEGDTKSSGSVERHPVQRSQFHFESIRMPISSIAVEALQLRIIVRMEISA